jgi:hypothetical protein
MPAATLPDAPGFFSAGHTEMQGPSYNLQASANAPSEHYLSAAGVTNTRFAGPVRVVAGADAGVVFRPGDHYVGARAEANLELSLPLNDRARKDDHGEDAPSYSNPLTCLAHGSSRALSTTSAGVDLAPHSVEPFVQNLTGVDRECNLQVGSRSHSLQVVAGALTSFGDGKPKVTPGISVALSF